MTRELRWWLLRRLAERVAVNVFVAFGVFALSGSAWLSRHPLQRRPRR
jgi:hypothetical protein